MEEMITDIIVPIYNGYEDLKQCVASIRNHTAPEEYRLILIDDCSTDARIIPYLNSLEDENTVIIRNKKNLGFSENVNKGMNMSDERDVLLLNSDTIVTEGWLDKIRACAYRSGSTGTVTPLSNSATLCSVPVFCQDNPLPEGFTVDTYAALIERCSLHRYPKISVAVGFCMYIKRCVIRDTGIFDAKTFEKGYGEENDFCCRAGQAGYSHVLCDDTFVFHKGTVSFDTNERIKLTEEHSAILEERYPLQMEANRLYCTENPDQEIRDNIIFHTELCNGRKNILYLLHLDFREHAMHNVGGTQIHVRELTEAFRKDYNVFVAARDGRFLNLTVYTEKEETLLRFEIGDVPAFPSLKDDQMFRIYEQILKVFSIDLIHVHHTQDVTLEIYDAAEKLNIPVITTLHDFYYACPTVLLLDKENRFCQPLNKNMSDDEKSARCRGCLQKRLGISPDIDYLALWQREHKKALLKCRKLIFPSQSAMDIMLEYYPGLRDRSVVIMHGEDRPAAGIMHHTALPAAAGNPKLKIRLENITGTGRDMNHIKGWAYIEGIKNEETQIYAELTDSKGVTDTILSPKEARPDIEDAFGDPDARMCGFNFRVSSEKLSDGPLKFKIYVKYRDDVFTDGQIYKGKYRRKYGEQGRLNVAFTGGMVLQKGAVTAQKMIQLDKRDINWFVFGEIGDEQMMGLNQDNCFFSYQYKKEELQQLFADNEIDVVCILPIWPETFSYTVSEAWMNSIPVVAADIGAVGERVRKSGGGWLVPPDEKPEKIVELLHYIKDNPDEYKKKKDAVARIKLKSTAEMCGDYRDLYSEILKESEFSKRDVLNTADADYDFIFQALALGNPSINGHGSIAVMNRLKNENEALKASFKVLKETSSYRLARKISEARIPFKDELKKAARRIVK